MSLAVCRVCLANNIRMKTIANTELQTLFEKLTNNKLIADDGMPQSVCYVCLLLLQRCCKFVEISQRSEKFLTQLLHDGIELTQETLSRTNNGIQNTLLHGLKVSNTTFVSILDNFKEENFKVTIKTEPEKKYYVVIENENSHEAEISDGNESIREDKSELASPKSGEDSVSFVKQSQEIKCDIPVRNYQRNKTKKKLKEETKTTDYKKPEKDKKIAPTLVIHADYKHVITNKKETHKSKNNVKNNIITYKCNKCPKAFRQKWYLKKHISFHAGENPYVCNICAAGFISPVLLKQHKAAHTDTPYSCHICSKQFGQKPHLTEHIRTHTGEKPHSCDHCEYTFAHRSSLTRHMRTHTGEKPYICHKCSRRFVQVSNLKKHVPTCQVEKKKRKRSYVCVKCSH